MKAILTPYFPRRETRQNSRVAKLVKRFGIRTSKVLTTFVTGKAIFVAQPSVAICKMAHENGLHHRGFVLSQPVILTRPFFRFARLSLE